MTDISYEEFLSEVQRKGSKPHRIAHCLGVRDAWRWARRLKWGPTGGSKFTSDIFSRIVDTVNQELSESLLEGHEVVFPHQMGTLRLIGRTPVIKSRGNRIVTNYRTDWGKTMRCWYEDSSMRSQRRLIKRPARYICSISYLKSSARYRNRRFYSFRANRSLVRRLGKRIEEGKVNFLIC